MAAYHGAEVMQPRLSIDDMFAELEQQIDDIITRREFWNHALTRADADMADIEIDRALNIIERPDLLWQADEIAKSRIQLLVKRLQKTKAMIFGTGAM